MIMIEKNIEKKGYEESDKGINREGRRFTRERCSFEREDML